ncbi:conserved Plasmodium protein, unknown function [Plasmodium ovale wallikeri]|uniref:Uncharacterized protein n=2 Tax=Plasmodium ovale TaxID=36330 RepID=A0A1A8Z2A7_PLAOA|nr:conserved Plasmodium protein, unknown function [Plasmodium ovale wallikeri]SBT38594.1 conserved Plasmodium protein, unknown function [Plasmodium ovale wallikeri]SBT77671.1 conserved Plasmodium protein, unknown function [Plasmodium ovale]
MGKPNIKDYGTMCQWFKRLSNKKAMPLLPEKKDERLKRFTNFSLYHIMEKYEFLPNFLLQTEYLYPHLYQSPETLRQSYFNHHRFSSTQGGTKNQMQ